MTKNKFRSRTWEHMGAFRPIASYKWDRYTITERYIYLCSIPA